MERRNSQLTIVFKGCSNLQDDIKTYKDAVDTALIICTDDDDVLIDISNISHIRSRTIGALMSMYTLLKDCGVNSKFRINSNCRASLEVIGLDRVFNIKYKEISL